MFRARFCVNCEANSIHVLLQCRYALVFFILFYTLVQKKTQIKQPGQWPQSKTASQTVLPFQRIQNSASPCLRRHPLCQHIANNNTISAPLHINTCILHIDEVGKYVQVVVSYLVNE